MLGLAAVAGGVALVGLPAASSAASPAVIVYQCPGSATPPMICAISPAGGQPRTLAQSGTLAGVTSDGATYGYTVPNSGIWEAPVAGGTPTEVNSLEGSTLSLLPVMSPDGQHFLMQYEIPGSGIVIFPTWYLIQYNVAAGPSSASATLESDLYDSFTYGWLGTTPLTAHFQNNGDLPPSWVCIGGQVKFNGNGCAQGASSPQIQSSTSGLLDPSGSPDGTEIVAIVAPSGQIDGSIALFSATTGALIRTIATPPAGTGYASPRFSPDGTQVVFESDPLDANGQPTGQGSIDIVNTDGTGLKTLTQGTNPFWGGTASSGGRGGRGGTRGRGQPAAPRVTLTVPRQKLKTVRRTRRLTFSCTLAGAGTCTIKATISGKTARHLELTLSGKHAKTYTLARASKTLKKKGTVKLTLRLSARTAAALRHTKTLKITLTASSTAPNHKARSASKTVTLR